MIHLQQTREGVFLNTSKLQERTKKVDDMKTKKDDFNMGDVVLHWDAQNEERGKCDMSLNLWKEPYKILASRGKNAYFLGKMDGEDYGGGPVNCRLLNHYLF